MAADISPDLLIRYYYPTTYAFVYTTDTSQQTAHCWHAMTYVPTGRLNQCLAREARFDLCYTLHGREIGNIIRPI